jgi:CubicO group peptidase (beta-lactamase class C family)
MTDALFAKLSSVIQEEMTRQGVPGVAVGVWYDSQSYTAGFGVTNVDHPLPVDDETLAQIGSISKTMTATAVMRLVEKGLLDLDVPVRRYLPDLRLADEKVAAAVTLRHLLNHTGGWAGDYFSETGLGDDALARYVDEMAELPQLTPLGEVWAYNNSAFSLAGRVIEAVTGQTYEQAMQELVFDPLGMEQAFFFANDVMTYGFVVGHSGRDAGPEPQVLRPWALARSAHSAGGVVTNVGELLRYARLHLGDGTAVDGVPFLRPATLQEMQTPRTEARLGSQFGISWFIKEVDGTRLVSHGGATKGQQASFLIVPQRQFALCFLTNSDDGEHVYTPATKWALKHYLGLEELESQPQERSEEALAEYVGEYEAQAAHLSLLLEDGELVLHVTPRGGFPDKDSPASPPPPPTRLAFTGADQIIALDVPQKGMRADFIRDKQGRIAWLRTSRLHRRQ